MKKAKYILITIGIVLLSLPVFSQYYYDTSGHVLMYQKGEVLFDSSGRVLNITGIISGTCFDEFYHYNENMDYKCVHRRGQEVYTNGRVIGRIETYRVSNEHGVEIGYFDKDADEYIATIFYFLLLPNWGNKVP